MMKPAKKMKQRMHGAAPLAAFALGLGLVVAAGCAGTQRSPQAYRADTQKALESRNSQIKSCYDKVLARDAAAAGTITLRFVVEKDTGAFAKATVDPATTSAKEPLVVCVLEAVNGLKLQPPDDNEGRATFSYELQPSPPPAPPT
jgi:hypothetical protein